MGREYVGRYELKAHFETCPRCKNADLSTTAGLAQLCIEGARMVKDFAAHSRRASAAKQTNAKAAP